MVLMMLKQLKLSLYLSAGTVHQHLNVCILLGRLLSLIHMNQLTSLKIFMLLKKQLKRGGKQKNSQRPKKKQKRLQKLKRNLRNLRRLLKRPQRKQEKNYPKKLLQKQRKLLLLKKPLRRLPQQRKLPSRLKLLRLKLRKKL